MPKYKLTYFNLRARGEIIRMLFSVAGVAFEDYRVDLDEHFNPAPEFAEIKKKTPFGQLPILEVEGEVLAQSHAIERFLAREFGLDGVTSLEKAPAVFGALENALSANKGGFIVGDKLTVADLAFLSVRDWLSSAYKQEGVAILARYEAVDQHVTKISQIPAIADWLKKRPETL